MRVFLVSEYAPSEYHGIAIRVRNMAMELTKQGHTVKVFTSRTRDELRNEGVIADGRLTEEQLGMFTHMGPCITNMWNAGNRICVAPGYELIKDIISGEGEEGMRPDVLHVFTPTIIGETLFWFKRAYFSDIWRCHIDPACQ